MANVDYKSVLIVGNDKGMRGLLKCALRQLGFEHISEAEDARSAIRMKKEGAFNLVLRLEDAEDDRTESVAVKDQGP